MADAEEQLTERIRKHDAQALGHYLDTKRPQLLAFIEHQLGASLRRKVEPEDMLQEVSVEAVRSLPQIELGDRDVFGWLCQIAERRIIDAHRKFFGTLKRDAGREVPLGTPGGDTQHAAIIDMLVASMTTASQAFSRNLREVRLAQAIASLAEDQREALRLRYVENLPSKEIATRLGKTDGAVRVMLTRSLSKLQELLGTEG
jgi:RNA polymerase sigma-70 factor (ECF subfamily)